MKKLHKKHQNWLLAKSKKELRRRHKRNRKKNVDNHKDFSSVSSANILNSNNSANKRHSYIIAPSKLSLINNPLETLGFFQSVKACIKATVLNGSLFFDLSVVEEVTVDAIMYLIAFIKNTKRLKALNIQCAGNFPSNLQSRHIFETCGFYKYVSVKSRFSYPKQYDNIKITRGREANPVLAGEICSFVHQHSKLKRIDTKFLYTMILELMTNTKQHAYNDSISMDNNWYVYVENLDNYLSFVFLDTGEGIPNTIRTKGVTEKIINAFNFADASFIASAFKGDVLRSETKLDYRGRGLPEIYKRISNKYIDDFMVISGFGKCIFKSNGEILETNLDNDLLGTMFCWKINKEANDELNN